MSPGGAVLITARSRALPTLEVAVSAPHRRGGLCRDLARCGTLPNMRFSTAPLMVTTALLTGCTASSATNASVTRSTAGPKASPASPATAGTACAWRAQVVNHDGASGHEATVIGLTNVSRRACPVPGLTAVWSISKGGLRVDASKGSYFPIGPAVGPVSPGQRVEFVVDTERLDDCGTSATSRLVGQVGMKLASGGVLSVALGEPIEAGCRLAYGPVGAWD